MAGIFDVLPYTNFHELNLDWIIEKIEEIETGSSITYELSITNNVISLTGSDGSVSNITLPVYNGGVL